MNTCHSQENGCDYREDMEACLRMTNVSFLSLMGPFTEVHRILHEELSREQKGLKGGKKGTKREGRGRWGRC